MQADEVSHTKQWNNGTTEQYERPTSNYNQINHRAAHVYTLEKEEEDEAALKSNRL